MEQKDERRIVVCQRNEKKLRRKSGDESDDDSDDEKFSKSAKLKFKTPDVKLTHRSKKAKR